MTCCGGKTIECYSHTEDIPHSATVWDEGIHERVSKNKQTNNWLIVHFLYRLNHAQFFFVNGNT